MLSPCRGPRPSVGFGPSLRVLWRRVCAVAALVAAGAVHPSGIAAQSPPVPVADVRIDVDGDGIADRVDDTVTVAGRATSAGHVLNSGQLRFHIQDATAGVQIFRTEADSSVEQGDSVVATGVVGQYRGVTQVTPLELRVVPARSRVPDPVLLSVPVDPDRLEALEGRLVRARAVVKGHQRSGGGQLLLAGSAQETEPAFAVFVAHDHVDPPPLHRFAVGDEIEVVGIVGQYHAGAGAEGGYQIYPRSSRDLHPVGLGRRNLQRLALLGSGLLALALLAVLLLRAEIRRRTRALAESERVARGSKECLSFFLQQAPVVLWTLDRDLRFTWVEGRGLTDLGVTHDRVVGRTVPDVFGTDDPDDPRVAGARRALAGEPVELDVDWGGRTWQVHLHPLEDDGSGAAVVGAAQDVTDHREMERRLEEQGVHFRTLFHEAPEAIVLVDEEDRALEVNREFERLFGYEPREVRGRRVGDLVAPPGHADEAVALTRRVARGERLEVEAVRRRSDGRPVQVSILATPVEVAGERRVYGIYRDITEQKSLEAQLLHSQRLEAVGQLAGGVAHDFNNILTAILGHTRVALSEVAEDSGLRDDLEQIEAGGERAARLTRQLLTFSRRDMTAPRIVDVNQLIEGIRHFLRRLIEERVELAFDLAPGLARVKADPGQLEQIVVNLVINARDAMEGGGRVTVATRQARLERGAAGRGREWVILEVGDDGRGMTEEERARMFEPFFTTKGPGQGTGLGLSTVYGIVEQAGGFIEVESRLGEGTLLRICLPARDPHAEEGAESDHDGRSPLAEAAGDDQVVLLVDDDRPVREVTARILERAGFRVVAKSSGDDALEFCSSSRVVPDAVVSDIVMPGISGYQLIERLRELHPGIPFLLMTGYTEVSPDPDDGYGEILRKPFDARTLVRRLRERLGEG